MSRSSLADLVADLDHAIEAGDADRRREMLRRITDLFVLSAPQLGDSHTDVFGEVISRLATDADSPARQELSERIAPIPNAPHNVVVGLAMDLETTVARPVLTTSTVLSDDDLVRVAEERGQGHMLAIAERATISERVSDTLVTRGESPVLRVVASNAGARFSDHGFSRLAEHATSDTVLATTLQSRADLPANIADAIAGRDAAMPDPALRQAQEQARAAEEAMKRAIRDVDVLVTSGTPCDEALMLDLAGKAKHEHVLAAFGRICDLRPEIVIRLPGASGIDCIMINGRAAGMSWRAVHTALIAGRRGAELAPRELAQQESDYRRLSTTTSRRIVRFWKTREVAARMPAA